MASWRGLLPEISPPFLVARIPCSDGVSDGVGLPGLFNCQEYDPVSGPSDADLDTVFQEEGPPPVRPSTRCRKSFVVGGKMVYHRLGGLAHRPEGPPRKDPIQALEKRASAGMFTVNPGQPSADRSEKGNLQPLVGL